MLGLLIWSRAAHTEGCLHSYLVKCCKYLVNSFALNLFLFLLMTEAVAECRILLAQSPDLHPLCPAYPSTLHHVPLQPTHMISTSSSLPTLATSQHTRATTSLDYRTLST